MRLSRLSTDLSVRTRLVVLSLIPVVGFAAIAFAYLSSEREVDAAVGSVPQTSRLADASRAVNEARNDALHDGRSFNRGCGRQSGAGGGVLALRSDGDGSPQP